MTTIQIENILTKHANAIEKDGCVSMKIQFVSVGYYRKFLEQANLFDSGLNSNFTNLIVALSIGKDSFDGIYNLMEASDYLLSYAIYDCHAKLVKII